MNKKLYVGNLEYSTTDKELEELFSSEGTVTYAKVVMREDGKSRGFGFIEMGTEEEAKKALEKFNQSSFKDRTIVVNEARNREKRDYGGRKSYNTGNKVKGDLNYKLRKLRRDYK